MQTPYTPYIVPHIWRPSTPEDYAAVIESIKTSLANGTPLTPTQVTVLHNDAHSAATAQVGGHVTEEQIGAELSRRLAELKAPTPGATL